MDVLLHLKNVNFLFYGDSSADLFSVTSQGKEAKTKECHFPRKEISILVESRSSSGWFGTGKSAVNNYFALDGVLYARLQPHLIGTSELLRY